MNLVTPKVGAKFELLFNQLASGFGHTGQRKLIKKCLYLVDQEYLVVVVVVDEVQLGGFIPQPVAERRSTQTDVDPHDVDLTRVKKHLMVAVVTIHTSDNDIKQNCKNLQTDACVRGLIKTTKPNIIN